MPFITGLRNVTDAGENAFQGYGVQGSHGGRGVLGRPAWLGDSRYLSLREISLYHCHTLSETSLVHCYSSRVISSFHKFLFSSLPLQIQNLTFMMLFNLLSDSFCIYLVLCDLPERCLLVIL